MAWLVIAAAFTIYAVIFNNKPIKPAYDYRVPKPPSERYDDKYWLWNSTTKDWDLIDIKPYDRAKAISKPELDEDALNRYLEKKIDGYMEDTYWGEEWDLNDKED